MSLFICANYNKKRDTFQLQPFLINQPYFQEAIRNKVLVMDDKTSQEYSSQLPSDCIQWILIPHDSLQNQVKKKKNICYLTENELIENIKNKEIVMLCGSKLFDLIKKEEKLKLSINHIYLTLTKNVNPTDNGLETTTGIPRNGLETDIPAEILESYHYLGNWEDTQFSFELVDHVGSEWFGNLDKINWTELSGNSNAIELLREKIDKLSESDAYHILHYKKRRMKEDVYHKTMTNILLKGESRPDRTGVGTRSLFGVRMEFDLLNGKIPLMTTRFIPFRVILEELLWFLRGETNTKSLEKKGVTIWRENSSRTFLDARGLTDYPEGELGPTYGWQWRNFGAPYPPKQGENQDKGIDQIAMILHLLKTDPFSRRIVLTAWNPAQLHQIALPPCHIQAQFYVDTKKQLSCLFTMRSSDCLAWSFNIVSYAILTHFLAKKTGLTANKIIYNAGDCHIYEHHLSAISTQLTRNSRPYPIIEISPSIIDKDWSEIQTEDVELIGYFPHPKINMTMAV